MKIDMSPEAVTARMRTLDELWKLATALKSSEIVAQPEITPEDGNEATASSKVVKIDVHSETSQ